MKQVQQRTDQLHRHRHQLRRRRNCCCSIATTTTTTTTTTAMMMMKSILSVILVAAVVVAVLVLPLIVNVVHSYPNGAGSCRNIVDGGALGGSHILRDNNTTYVNATSSISNSTTSSSIGDFIVSIGNTTLLHQQEELESDSNDRNTFLINTPYVLSVVSATNSSASSSSSSATNSNSSNITSIFIMNIKGILIRMEVPTTGTTNDTTATNSYYSFEPNINTQYEDSCLLEGSDDGTTSTTVTGLTHITNDSNKTVHSGLLQFSIPTNAVQLDITVVYQNNVFFSIYDTHRYTIHFIDQSVEDNATVSAPTISPTVPSAITPTNVPVASPTTTTNDTTSRLRKDPNNTISLIPPSSETERTTQSIMVPNIQVSLSYILLLLPTEVGDNTTSTTTTWSDKEIRAYERITMQWYELFYNSNFYITDKGDSDSNVVHIVTFEHSDHNDTTIETTELERTYDNSDNGNRYHRQLQPASNSNKYLSSLYDNYGIVMGSMKTYINVTNITYTPYSSGEQEVVMTATDSNVIKSDVMITYTQYIEYETIPDNNDDTTGNDNKLQYITIPYRSKIGRQLYVESLLNSSLYTFSQLSLDNVNNITEDGKLQPQVVSIPILYGPQQQQVPPSNVDNDNSSTSRSAPLSTAYILLIICGSLLLVISIMGFMFHYIRQQRAMASKINNDDDDDEDVDDEKEITTSTMNMIHHDMETFRFSNTPPLHGPGQHSNLVEEYHIYAPAGRLGIILDDPYIVYSNFSSPTMEQTQPPQFGAVISIIKENSPLIHETQMNVGDCIVAIDDIDVRGMKPKLISKFLNDRSKYPVRKITCIKNRNITIFTNTTNTTAAA